MSTVNLRPYQKKLKADISEAWMRGARRVLAVAPTGSGKTAVMADISSDMTGPGCDIAHRQELVGQMSLAAAKGGVYHRIIASDSVMRFCVDLHIHELGQNYVHPSAPLAVSSVQTIIRREDVLRDWMRTVQLWKLDEGHHLLPANIWGRAVAMFPNAWGLGVTATPLRGDAKGLDQSYDTLVLGPTPRELINMGYLADYRIWAPTNSIDTRDVTISKATGDFSQNQLRTKAHESTITGDIVEHYLRIAAGKRGITFTVDVEQAMEVAARFESAGVPAACVSAKTPDRVRQSAIDQFRRGEIRQLVNVDLFGEGFDVPSVEVVSMGRPTQSYGLYVQQFGRALRPLEGKTHGMIIDHVQNVQRHGLPDSPRHWSLEVPVRKRGTRDPNDALPIRVCEECFMCFEATTNTCPHCGWVMVPESRSHPKFVDGDLIEFSPELLAELRGEIAAVEFGEPAIPLGAERPIVTRLNKLHLEKQAALGELREAINLWAGIETTLHGRTESAAYRVFYHRFGVDVLTAQTLDRKQMQGLTETIRGTYQ